MISDYEYSLLYIPLTLSLLMLTFVAPAEKFANSLDPDQDVSPDQDSNRLTL